MNAKRVKSFRRSMRAMGHDPREATYLMERPKRGNLAMGTVTLDPRCGRAMYQAAKQEARRS